MHVDRLASHFQASLSTYTPCAWWEAWGLAVGCMKTAATAMLQAASCAMQPSAVAQAAPHDHRGCTVGTYAPLAPPFAALSSFCTRGDAGSSTPLHCQQGWCMSCPQVPTEVVGQGGDRLCSQGAMRSGAMTAQ